jgi:hypothetical protein
MAVGNYRGSWYLDRKRMADQPRLVIPDIHHKVEAVNTIRRTHPGIPAIFLGDYFDDFHDTPAHMRATCQWLKAALEDPADQFLLGNHCFAYLSYELGVRWGFCSGWTLAKQQIFHEYFPADTLLERSQWMLQCQGWLISHAGLSNEIYRSFSKRKTSDEIFHWVADAGNALTAGVAHPAFLAGVDRGGPQRVGGILWCDWERFKPIPGIRQTVGHTPGMEVRYKTGNVCLDTHLAHYGLLENRNLTILPSRRNDPFPSLV